MYYILYNILYLYILRSQRFRAEMGEIAVFAASRALYSAAALLYNLIK